MEFTDNSTADIDSWEWDFGDGNASNQQNPTHTYEEAGTFTTEWQMLKEGEFWFGEKFSKEVEVSVRTGIGSPLWNLFE